MKMGIPWTWFYNFQSYKWFWYITISQWRGHRSEVVGIYEIWSSCNRSRHTIVSNHRKMI